MLMKDPDRRIKMLKILNHKWFQMTDHDIDQSQILASRAKKLKVMIKDKHNKLKKQLMNVSFPKDKNILIKPKMLETSNRFDILK